MSVEESAASQSAENPSILSSVVKKHLLTLVGTFEKFIVAGSVDISSSYPILHSFRHEGTRRIFRALGAKILQRRLFTHKRDPTSAYIRKLAGLLSAKSKTGNADERRLARERYVNRICEVVADMDIGGLHTIEDEDLLSRDDYLPYGFIEYFLPGVAATTGDVHLFEDVASPTKDELFVLVDEHGMLPSALRSAVVLNDPRMLKVVLEKIPCPDIARMRMHNSIRLNLEICLQKALGLALRRQKNECAILLIKYAVAGKIIVDWQSIFTLCVSKQNAELLSMIAHHLRSRK